MALFGRKINHAEHQLAFIEMLRLITDGRISPEEAVRAYHGVLQGKGLRPHRPLEEDLKLTHQAMSYDGSGRQPATVAARNHPLANPKPAVAVEGNQSFLASSAPGADWPKRNDGSPDFANMTGAQRVAYDRWRMRRFG